MARRIRIRELERLRDALGRFLDKIDQVYDIATERWQHDEQMIETIRNAATALPHIRIWIEHRRNHRKDPGEPLSLAEKPAP